MASRPRNISVGNLLHYKFPVTAIGSILHRVSGVLLFVAVPFLIWAFDYSLSSAKGFQSVHAFLNGSGMRFLVWFISSALIYHFFAGLKHIFMDLGYFENKVSGKVASWIVIVVSLVLIISLGVCLW